jgi:TrmH family RNA methyltransferase
VRRVRQLLRKRSLRAAEQSLVVEGAELVSMAVGSGTPIESVYVAPEGRRNPAVALVVEQVFAAGGRVFDLAPGVIERISDTVSPQPIIAVVGFAPPPLADLEQASMVVVCVDVRDPGNAGTIIRTADAAGVDAVVCCDGTVDPTNPKTVRASAGSLFHIPVVAGGEAMTVIERLRGWGLTAVGTGAGDGTDYVAFDWCQRVAVVLGNEASGLDAPVRRALDASVSIPMVGRAESLNVSVAAAVLCFEALRQRRATGMGAGPRTTASLRGSTIPGMGGAPGGPAESMGDGNGEGDR